MPATSPYVQNDYQAASNYRPYELPINDIFKGLAAQDQFWKMGAERVNSVYNNALDLQLSLAPNQEIRKQFIQDANKQLTKLSSMDLSDPSVQRQGFGIFKPLFQDEGVISDDAATRHIDKVNQDALSFRNKNNGKEYSAVNHQYALLGADEFKHSTDRMAGKTYLEKAKDYEPFYDPASELSTILKNCKPDKVTNDSVQGYYISSYSNQSLSAAKINTCMDAGLSDRAKRQLEINGAVTYHNQPQALAQKYIPYLQGTRSQLSEEKAAVDGVLANKGNLKNLKKDQLNKLGISDVSQVTPELIQSLTETSKGLDDRIFNLGSSISKLLSGDFSPISGDNYEKVASTVYSRDYMQNVGEGFSYNFATNTRKADPVQMLFYKEHEQNARQDDQQQFEREQQAAKLDEDYAKRMIGKTSLSMMLKMSGVGDMIEQSRVQNTTTSPFSSIDKSDSYEKVLDKIKILSDKRKNIQQVFHNQLVDMGMPDSNAVGSPEEKKFVENFSIAAGNDPVKQNLIMTYNKDMDDNTQFGQMLKNNLDYVDKQVEPMKQKIASDIANIAPAVFQGMHLTGSDMSRLMVGENVNGIQLKQETAQYSSSGPFTSPTPEPIFYFNGNKVDLVNRGSSDLFSLYQKVNKVTGEGIQAYSKKRNEVMQANTVLQRESYMLPGLNDNVPDGFKAGLARKIGLDEKFIDDLVVEDADLNGNLIVKLNTSRSDAKKDYDVKEVLKNLKNYGGTDNPAVPGQDNTYELQNISNLDIIDESRFSDIFRPAIRAMENNVTPTHKMSTGFIQSGNQREYRLDISTGFKGLNYKIVDKEMPFSPVFSFDNRDAALQKFEQILARYPITK